MAKNIQAQSKPYTFHIGQEVIKKETGERKIITDIRKCPHCPEELISFGALTALKFREYTCTCGHLCTEGKYFFDYAFAYSPISGRRKKAAEETPLVDEVRSLNPARVGTVLRYFTVASMAWENQKIKTPAVPFDRLLDMVAGQWGFHAFELTGGVKAAKYRVAQMAFILLAQAYGGREKESAKFIGCATVMAYRSKCFFAKCAKDEMARAVAVAIECERLTDALLTRTFKATIEHEGLQVSDAQGVRIHNLESVPVLDWAAMYKLSDLAAFEPRTGKVYRVVIMNGGGGRISHLEGLQRFGWRFMDYKAATEAPKKNCIGCANNKKCPMALMLSDDGFCPKLHTQIDESKRTWTGEESGTEYMNYIVSASALKALAFYGRS